MARYQFNPSALNSAEKKIVAATATGQWASLLSRSSDPLIQPSGRKPIVRSEFLRHLLLGLPVEGHDRKPWFIAPTGVRIIGAKISGTLDLTDACGIGGSNLPALALEYCDIADPIRLDHADVERLSLRGSRLRELSGREMSVGGQVDLSYVVPMPVRDLPEQCWVNMDGARIDGDLSCIRAQFIAPQKRSQVPAEMHYNYALELRDAEITGRLRAFFVTAIGGIILAGADVGSEAWFIGATLKSAEGYAFNGQSTNFRSKLLICACLDTGKPFEADGCVWLNGARIAGNLDASGGKFRNYSENGSDCALEVQNGYIGGSCYLRNNFEADGCVWLKGVEISGNLEMSGGKLRNCVQDGSGCALDVQNGHIGGSCFFNKNFESIGCVLLFGVRVDGSIDAEDSKFRNSNSDDDFITINACNIHVGQDLHIGPKFFNTGKLMLIGARINLILLVDSLDSSKTEWDLTDASAGTLIDNDGEGWGGAGTKLYLQGFTYNRIVFNNWFTWSSRKRWFQKYVEPYNDFRPQPYVQLYTVFCAMGLYDAARNLAKYWRQRSCDSQALIWIRLNRLPMDIFRGWFIEARAKNYSKFIIYSVVPIVVTICFLIFIFTFIISLILLIVAWLPRQLFGFLFGFGLSPIRALATFLVSISVGSVAFSYANSHGMMDVDAMPVSGTPFITVKPLPGIAFVSNTDPNSVKTPCGDLIEPTLYAIDVFIPFIDLRQESKCEPGQMISGGDEISQPPSNLENPKFWRWFKAFYALAGSLITSLFILTFSGILQNRSREQG